MTLDAVVAVVGGGVFGLVLIGLLEVFRHAVSETVEDERSRRVRVKSSRIDRGHEGQSEVVLEPVRVPSAPVRVPGRE